jgi:hypothetical protein
MGKRKAPDVGDYIIHKEPYFNRENEGTVEQLLAMQFVYVTPNGNRRHCMFSEDWKLKNE